MRLDLGEEVDVALTDPPDAGDVDPVEVVDCDHDAAAARNPLGAVGPEARRDRRGEAEHWPAEGPDEVFRFHAAGERSWTSAAIRSTTSSTSRLVVSISI